MPFQSTVAVQQGFGIPGELFTDSPHRAAAYTLRSATSSLNIIGATAFTVLSEGVAKAGLVGANAAYAGILANPKELALFGSGGNPLAPTLVVPNETIASLVTMGDLIVTLPAAAAIGDYVIYDNTTGALSTVAAGATTPGAGKSWANAVVSYYTVAGAGLAVITMNPGVGIPTN